MILLFRPHRFSWTANGLYQIVWSSESSSFVLQQGVRTQGMATPFSRVAAQLWGKSRLK